MSHQRFYALLDQVPRICHLWDREARELKVELFERELGVMSPGEAYMAKFFAAVWFGDSKRYGFDLVDAVSRIDPPERQLIIGWIADPFWP